MPLPVSAAFATPAPVAIRRHRAPSVRYQVTPRAALAKEPQGDAPKYVGTAPRSKRGRLRVAPFLREGVPVAPPSTDADRYRWSSGGYNAFSRSTAIWSFVGVLVARNYLDGKRVSYLFFDKTEEKVSARRRALAAWARERILNLGPTMIKVGQLAAARADILPGEVIEELSLLTDKVPAFKWNAAEKILVDAYGKPLTDIFSYVETTPLAAASLGQVHRAGLKDGTDVVIKIQRPGLKKLFDLDLDALRIVAEYLQRSKKYGGETRDWVGIYEECKKTLYEEIDYMLELSNGERFLKNFASTPWIIIPKPYREYSTGQVLCMQYVPGIPLRDKEAMLEAGIDPKLVANRSAQFLLRSILDHAFFTADPHWGNFACVPQLGGSLVCYDFGMTATLNPKIKEQLVTILLGVIEKDATVVMDTLVDLGALVLPPDPEPVRRSIQFFLDQIGQRPNREQTVAAIGDDLYATAQDKPFRLPAASIFLLRALSTTEGVNKTLDPDFRFSDVSAPFADELLRGRRGSSGESEGPGAIFRSLADAALTGKPDVLTQQIQKRLVGAGSNAVKAAARIEKMEATLNQIERGDLKVNVSRGFVTERLLRKQVELTKANNYLVASGASAVLAFQVYSSGQPVEGAAALAAVAVLSAIVYSRKAAYINKDLFK